MYMCIPILVQVHSTFIYCVSTVFIGVFTRASMAYACYFQLCNLKCRINLHINVYRGHRAGERFGLSDK